MQAGSKHEACRKQAGKMQADGKEGREASAQASRHTGQKVRQQPDRQTNIGTGSTGTGSMQSGTHTDQWVSGRNTNITDRLYAAEAALTLLRQL